MSNVIIDSFGPVRPSFRPGTPAVVAATLASVDGTLEADVHATLLDADRPVVRVSRPLTITETPQVVEFHLDLPAAPRHGYGLRLEVESDATTAAEASAVEALDAWWESPRHAAVTTYTDVDEAAAATAGLVGWHVGVIQHYDWMWRHYRYRPPHGARVFGDALGRTVSHDAVRASIAAGHECGIASLAYGSVYGAEPEHVEQHPEDRVFDDAGEALSLGGTFFINDIRPRSAWRARLLGEYEDALAGFGFDGIHMDTYGPPYAATGSDGEHLDFRQLYPGLVDEAAALAERTTPGARMIFNCVDGFPLEAIAKTDVAALYLELWPPDDTFADVVRWVDHARDVAEGRQVVIAAYAATLKQLTRDADRGAAFETVLLLGSIIAAAGAYHHTLAEGDRLLVEGYYPAAVRMTPAEVEELRALWRFSARYVHLLSDPALTARDPTGLEVADHDGTALPWSTEPRAGSMWLRTVRTSEGTRVLHLVDMRSQTDARWTESKRVSPVADGLRLQRVVADAVRAMSPWSSSGDATRLQVKDGTVELPRFQRWLMLELC